MPELLMRVLSNFPEKNSPTSHECQRLLKTIPRDLSGKLLSYSMIHLRMPRNKKKKKWWSVLEDSISTLWHNKNISFLKAREDLLVAYINDHSSPFSSFLGCGKARHHSCGIFRQADVIQM